MVGSIRHKALRSYWTKGQAEGFECQKDAEAGRFLAAFEAADEPEGMNYTRSHFYPSKGDRTDRYSVRLTANVRVTFGWDEDSAAEIDIEDYH